MGDSAHTTHHTTPGMTHCHQKCVSKYLCNAKKTRRSSIECTTLYRATSRKPDREIYFRTHFWWQWVNKNDPSLISERTVWSSILLRAHGHQFLLLSFTLFATTFPEIWSSGISMQKYVNGKLLRRKLTENNNKYRVYQPDLQPDSVSWRYSGTKC